MFLTPDPTFFYIGLFYLQFVLTYSKGDQNGAKLTELWPERPSQPKLTRPLNGGNMFHRKVNVTAAKQLLAYSLASGK